MHIYNSSQKENECVKRWQFAQKNTLTHVQCVSIVNFMTQTIRVRPIENRTHTNANKIKLTNLYTVHVNNECFCILIVAVLLFAHFLIMHFVCILVYSHFYHSQRKIFTTFSNEFIFFSISLCYQGFNINLICITHINHSLSLSL